jgi:hypothetical protein
MTTVHRNIVGYLYSLSGSTPPPQDPPGAVSPPVVGAQGGGNFEPECVLIVETPAVFTGATSVSYRFYREGVAVGASGDATLTYQTSEFDHDVSYTVRATGTNSAGETVSESEPVIIESPDIYLRTDIKTWTADPQWVYSLSFPFAENPIRLRIDSGPNWTPGTYTVDGFIAGFDVGPPDGVVNLVHLTAVPASVTPAINGVGRPSPKDLYIAEGDSLTTGVGATSSSFAYPVQMLPLLDPAQIYQQINIGESARTLQDMIDDIETEVLPIYDPVLYRNIILGCWGGTNDLFYFAQGNPIGADGADAYARYITYCQTLRSFIPDIPVVISTPTPRQDLPDAPSQAIYDAERAIFIGLLAADHSFADALIRPDLDARLSDPTNLTWYNADKVHGTNAFYEVMAELFQPAVDDLFS